MREYVSERAVEIPFVLEHTRGPAVLDVGKDRTGHYTEVMENRGFVVESVDPYDTVATFSAHFEYLECLGPTRWYNTVLFLSSLEHFDLSGENLALARNDIYCICKARTMLAPGGVIIVTVPFGKLSVPGDFIQWDAKRVERVVQYCGVCVLEQRVMLRGAGDEWLVGSMYQCADVLYGDDGRGANAVYMGVWQ